MPASSSSQRSNRELSLLTRYEGASALSTEPDDAAAAAASGASAAAGAGLAAEVAAAAALAVAAAAAEAAETEVTVSARRGVAKANGAAVEITEPGTRWAPAVEIEAGRRIGASAVEATSGADAGDATATVARAERLSSAKRAAIRGMATARKGDRARLVGETMFKTSKELMSS